MSTKIHSDEDPMGVGPHMQQIMDSAQRGKGERKVDEL